MNKSDAPVSNRTCRLPVSNRMESPCSVGYNAGFELRLSARMVAFTSALVSLVMAAAAIVVTAAVTVHNGTAEIQFEQFFDRKFWRACVHLDAHLIENVHSSGAEASAEDIRAALGRDEAGHGPVLVLGSFEGDRFFNLSVFNGYDGYLRSLAEMGPKHSFAGGDGYLLVHHDIVYKYNHFEQLVRIIHNDTNSSGKLGRMSQ